MVRLTSQFIGELVDIVGEPHVLTDPDVITQYCVDWSGRYQGEAPAVVRPANTDDVSRILSLCSTAAVPVVPQGGNTGLVGGGVPLGGELVLSLRRLDEIGEVDLLAHQVRCGAGVTLADLQHAARGHGLEFGVDLGARDSCTIGGMVATNAGGIHVIRYGSMRAQIAGLESVLSNGSVLSHLVGLGKDNTGYDLDGLMCGSEGTLGVITRVTLRLHPALTHRTTAMIAVNTVTDAVELVAHLRRRVTNLLAVEAVFRSAMVVIEECHGLTPPVGDLADGIWLIVESGSQGQDPTDELAEAIDSWPDDLAVAVATDNAAAARLWQYREMITETLNQFGIPHKLDITLPASAVAKFTSVVQEVVTEQVADAHVVLFGHLG